MTTKKIYNLFCGNQNLSKVYLHNGIPRYLNNPLNIPIVNKPIKKFMTWNIQELFWYSNENKLNKIINFINTLDYDLICLQEVFEISSLEKILYNKDIFQKYPFSITGNMKSKYIIGENSGLLVLSKQPIQYKKFEPLLPYEFPDSGASKGILYFTVGEINFATTHLQSENELIAAQQMRLARDSSPFEDSFILLGDLNHRNADLCLQCKKNNFEFTHESGRILDYILPMNQSRVPPFKTKVINIFNKEFEQLYGMSDHCPIVAEFF